MIDNFAWLALLCALAALATSCDDEPKHTITTKKAANAAETRLKQ